MNKRSPLIAGTFAVLTTLLSSPPDAEANFKRQHASSCTEDSLQPLALFQDQFLINTSDSFFDFFFCGMPEDTALRKDRVVQLTLAGIDESTTNAVFVRACVGFSNGFGLQCDAMVSNGPAATIGPFTISVPHGSWNTSHRLDFAYLLVQVPPLESSFSGISGVFMADING
jgi:hypothetical protein